MCMATLAKITGDDFCTKAVVDATASERFPWRVAASRPGGL
jgi:hypothetical protein